MANINLHQSFERGEEMRKKPNFFASRTFISIIILVVFSGTYFALDYYRSLLEKEKQNVIDSKQRELTAIDTEIVSEVVDFNTRAKSIAYNLANKNKADENFARLEELILNSVYLNSYEYDYVEGLVSMEAVTGSYQSVAEQMLNLNKSGYFSRVEISSTKRDKEGQVVFNLELQLAKK
ncbi:MAG: PilN domain-containing protein [Candidatus Moranbacteria bacterium]|nr:PilN domain-containing protein [Candidatus Moranbacteria bacterium]